MPASEPPRFDGILLIDKPAGMTSASVVREVKRRLGGSRIGKIGHLGTLDPFATGLLPLAIGEGSKIVPFLNQEEKEYSGTIALGRATNTLDSTGETTDEKPVPALTAADVERAALRFRGTIDQVPPMFSALKRQGERLYDLARRGIELELDPRKVEIHELSLELADERTLTVSLRCSKGTYVRSLARDIAVALGTVGHLASLRRTGFGGLDPRHAIAIEAVDSSAELPILEPREALAGLREFQATESLTEQIRRGQQYALASLPGPAAPAEVAKVVGVRGDLVAIVESAGSGWRIARVLNKRPGSPARA